MSEYIGLDMSLKEAALSVRRDRKRIWRGAHFCATCIRATRFIPPLCECSANHAGRYEGYFSFCARARSGGCIRDARDRKRCPVWRRRRIPVLRVFRSRRHDRHGTTDSSIRRLQRVQSIQRR
ncbi:MAG: hypothetical protein EOQ86_04635 [Mesorhizobium sp.]|nr:MAG: hypothetical protein EOQ85_04580 [Mesorhizobium sp.]RWH87377.1 MAG: hypothetical protein EOQ86_04635 [Mesorhizobium sp.]RWH93080.1 MAG: hypothetical protein EOQ87_00470 [Mesorhizobium sp.]RWH99051.1 MAG: hypothetical protein EOQ88_12965 [Mesorhizobium sp.]RWI02402.1 MAG: hypothetical protein EOQ89_13910 [Mesorhizobium sp.]